MSIEDFAATATFLEVLIVLLGLPGLAISLLLVAVFQGERRTVKRAGQNGVNQRLINADLRNELLTASRFCGFITVGLMFALVLPPIRQVNGTVGVAVSVILILGEVLDTLSSLWRYVDRRRNMEALRGMETETETSVWDGVERRG